MQMCMIFMWLSTCCRNHHAAVRDASVAVNMLQEPCVMTCS